MNLIFGFLILVAIVVSILAIILLVGWWKGSDSIVFPGLGIIIATPLLAVLLLIAEATIILIASLVRSLGARA